ncbi:MAG: hypothetical protein H7A09_00100 [Oceanospirillaceae bacterium]|nr:hypothetical protein [Oceanospirillaceae bacterium]
MQLIKRLALGAMAASTFIISGCQPTQIKPVESGFNATTVTYTYNLGDQNISNKEIFDAVIKEFLPKLSVVRQFTIDPPTRYRDGTTTRLIKSLWIEIKYQPGQRELQIDAAPCHTVTSI